MVSATKATRRSPVRSESMQTGVANSAHAIPESDSADDLHHEYDSDDSDGDQQARAVLSASGLGTQAVRVAMPARVAQPPV
jgi:hypothetical protein